MRRFMPRLPESEFPGLLAEIEDPAIRLLFSERFLRASEIYDELIASAAWRILAEIGALPGEGELEIPEALPCAADRQRRLTLNYLVGHLIDAGYLRRHGGDAIARASAPPPEFEALAEELSSKEPDAAVGAEIVTLLVNEAGAYFRGEKRGEDILFSPARLSLWFRYFSNANLLYAINNTLGAEIAARVLNGDTRGGRRADVLEIGGGLGSAAELVLRRSGESISLYRFTELVPTFLRRGERTARAATPQGVSLEAGRLDMTKPWEEQGIAPESFDLVYSVNCFHVAPDLASVLEEARRALRPGGAVVVSECVKPASKPSDSFRPIYVSFVFEFLESFTNVGTHPERRPSYGFLTPGAWRSSFEAAGFRSVTLHPNIERIGRKYPNFFAGAIVAVRP